MAMTEKSCPPPISFIHWLSDRNQHRTFAGTRPLIATEPLNQPIGAGGENGVEWVLGERLFRGWQVAVLGVWRDGRDGSCHSAVRGNRGPSRASTADAAGNRPSVAARH